MATVMSDGAAEDLIRAFIQAACSEGHYKTLIEKYSAELNNGIIDVEDADLVQRHLDQLNDAMSELDAVAELRRSLMRYLMEMYGGDTSYWCLVKHLGTAQYNAFEAYQATGDAALLNLSLELNARLTKALTRFLGVEITDCAACFTDALRGQKKGEDDGGLH